MSRLTRTFLTIVLLIIGTLLFLAVIPSMIAALLGILLVTAVLDYASRRYRNHVHSFNRALRSVCHQEGAIGRIAVAFSRSGPLSSGCYEFTRRMMVGQRPVDAAIQAGLPLQLRTAIALENPTALDDWRLDQESADSELDAVDSTIMPVYGQFVYLVGASTMTALLMVYLSLGIVPTMKVMFDEFGLKMPFEPIIDSFPILSVIVLVIALATATISLLNGLAGMQLPRWFPMLPRRAARKAEFLRGLADGYETGIPVDRTLSLAYTISFKTSDRASLARTMARFQSGNDPIESIREGGWLSHREAAWLNHSNPVRTAQLLRNIADHNLRDAAANLRWMMAIYYPMMIFLLGLAVTLIAISFFGALAGLTNGLS